MSNYSELDGKQMVPEMHINEGICNVRCKECKHFAIDPFNRTVCARLTVQFPMNENDFCSYGESTKTIDCSKAVNYIRQKERMCKRESRYMCRYCPLDKTNNGTGDECYVFCVTYPERAVEAVQRWSQEP